MKVALFQKSNIKKDFLAIVVSQGKTLHPHLFMNMVHEWLQEAEGAFDISLSQCLMAKVKTD